MPDILHVVSFDVPYPDDYGGVIDVFHQLRWLKKSGIRVHLHAFTYGRPARGELLAHCEQIHYYGRGNSLTSLLKGKPHIVESRKNIVLLQKLTETNAPILFQGQHCTAWLGHELLKNRKQVVRLHNVENQYYEQLAKLEQRPIFKLHHQIEANRLLKDEKRLTKADALIPISATDQAYYENLFPHNTKGYIAPFHPQDFRIFPKPNKTAYALYHGNLKVAENQNAAKDLVKNIAPFLKMPLWVSGQAEDSFISFLQNQPNVRYVQAKRREEMNTLISEAQVNILISHQRSGLKLKLLHAISMGGFLVANSAILYGTGLENKLPCLDDNDKIIAQINLLKNVKWQQIDENNRLQILQSFDNRNQINRLLSILFD